MLVRWRYAGHILARFGCSGHFWSWRFGCVAMNEEHLEGLRYVALPVRAGAGRPGSGLGAGPSRPDRGRWPDGRGPVLPRYSDFASSSRSAKTRPDRCSFAMPRGSAGRSAAGTSSTRWNARTPHPGSREARAESPKVHCHRNSPLTFSRPQSDGTAFSVTVMRDRRAATRAALPVMPLRACGARQPHCQDASCPSRRR